MKFLVDHVVMGNDFEGRVQWEKSSVVILDGRTTLRKLLVANGLL